MNKNEFLSNLSNKLKNVSNTDIDKTVEYYSEIIDDRIEDGCNEEEVIKSLGSVDDIIRNIDSSSNSNEYIQSEDKSIGGIIDGILKNISGSASNQYIEKNYITSTPIDNIKVTDSNTSVVFLPSSDNNVHVNYFENNNYYYTINEENGKLTIEKQRRNRTFMFISHISFNNKITIYIPKNANCHVDAASSNASIRANDINVQDFMAHTSNSGITLEHVNALGQVYGHSTNGSIKVYTLNTNADLTCVTTNSRIEVENTSCANVSCKSSNGSMNIERISYNKSGEFITSNSSINFNNCTHIGDNNVFKTTNGSINANLPYSIKEYSITSSTSNGKNTLPSELNLGNRRLVCTTSNSSIKVYFAENESNFKK